MRDSPDLSVAYPSMSLLELCMYRLMPGSNPSGCGWIVHGYRYSIRQWACGLFPFFLATFSACKNNVYVLGYLPWLGQTTRQRLYCGESLASPHLSASHHSLTCFLFNSVCCLGVTFIEGDISRVQTYGWFNMFSFYYKEKGGKSGETGEHLHALCPMRYATGCRDVNGLG